MASLLDRLDRDRDYDEALEASLPSPLANRLLSAVSDNGQPPSEPSADGEGYDSGIDLDTEGDTPLPSDSPTPAPCTVDNRGLLSHATDVPTSSLGHDGYLGIDLDSEGNSESGTETSLTPASVRCLRGFIQLTSSPSPAPYA